MQPLHFVLSAEGSVDACPFCASVIVAQKICVVNIKGFDMTARPIAFTSLINKLTKRRTKPIYVVLEKRNEQKKWGTANYGEIPELINRADGDPWDVVVPGYPKLPVNEPFKFKKLLGVYYLPNGNHKLIVDVFCGKKQNRSIISKEMNKYQKTYENHNNIRGNLMYFFD